MLVEDIYIYIYLLRQSVGLERIITRLICTTTAMTTPCSRWFVGNVEFISFRNNAANRFHFIVFQARPRNGNSTISLPFRRDRALSFWGCTHGICCRVSDAAARNKFSLRWQYQGRKSTICTDCRG